MVFDEPTLGVSTCVIVNMDSGRQWLARLWLGAANTCRAKRTTEVSSAGSLLAAEEADGQRHAIYITPAALFDETPWPVCPCVYSAAVLQQEWSSFFRHPASAPIALNPVERNIGIEATDTTCSGRTRFLEKIQKILVIVPRVGYLRRSQAGSSV